MLPILHSFPTIDLFFILQHMLSLVSPIKEPYHGILEAHPDPIVPTFLHATHIFFHSLKINLKISMVGWFSLFDSPPIFLPYFFAFLLCRAINCIYLVREICNRRLLGFYYKLCIWGRINLTSMVLNDYQRHEMFLLEPQVYLNIIFYIPIGRNPINLVGYKGSKRVVKDIN